MDALLARPLEGIRVLDLTVALAGPYATLQLAGMGAQVIRIEAPGGSDIARNTPPFFGAQGVHYGPPQVGDLSLAQLNRQRNKHSITLNLKTAQGHALLMQLVAQSDVVVTNWSEGVAERLGVDWATVHAHSPRAICASISAFAPGHPYGHLKGMDILVQALSGVMEVTGAADGPPTRLGLPMADLVAPLFLVNGILAALLQRVRTGEGQHVQVAMLDCMASLLAVEHFDLLHHAGRAVRSGNSMDRLVPFGVYACADGHVAIAAFTPEWLAALLGAMGQPQLLHDARFASLGARQQHAVQLNALIAQWTQGLRCAQVLEALLAQRQVPCAVVRKPHEVLQDPALLASGALQALAHPQYGAVGGMGMGNPVRFSAAHAQYDQVAQPLGADNLAIYRELLALSEADIAALQAQGVL